MIQEATYHFSLEQYERLIETGVLQEDERIELLNGKLYSMTPIGPSHAYTVLQLTQRFISKLGERVVVSSQNPVKLPPNSEPEPDIALLKPPAETYRESLAEAEDILLVVEVADSSLEYDRTTKLPIYAQAGIPEIWIINLKDGGLEVYREPKQGRYGQLITYRKGDEVAPLKFARDEVDWWS